MKTTLLSALAAAALLAVSPSAFAADLAMTPPTTEGAAPSGSFEGAYVGIFGTAYVGAGQYGVGGELGYNLLPAENVLLGFEVSGVAFATGYDPELWFKGKLGFTADSIAVYGFGEVGGYFSGGTMTQQYGVGAGAEMFVADSVSLAGEVGMRADFGNSLANPHAQLGVRFHF